MKYSASRDVFPDRLRGLALLGIVVVNAAFLGINIDGYTQESIQGWQNIATMFAVITFAEGKFYLLFSFLFGYSAAYLLKNNSPSNRKRYLRRLSGLFLIGLVHSIFFFSGDILITYSVLGCGLFLLYRSSDRVITRWVISSGIVSVVLTSSLIILSSLDPESGSATGTLHRVLQDGTFWQAAEARLQALPEFFLLLLAVQGPMAFGAFLLGLLASRRRLLSQPLEPHYKLWKNLAIWGWSVGLPLQVISAGLQVVGTSQGEASSLISLSGIALCLITAPILAAGYLGTIALSIHRWPNFLSIMEPAGRMSLTTYIGESVLLSILFAGYGLGFYGQWGAFYVTLAGVASWAILSVFAHLWMRKQDKGPVEKVLALISGPGGKG